MAKMFFSGSFLGHAVQQVNLSIFHQALINAAHQTRLTFDLEIETTHGAKSGDNGTPIVWPKSLQTIFGGDLLKDSG